MRPDPLSPASSPTRKRRRMSSPSLDAQFPTLSQQELKELDEIEARLSQEPKLQLLSDFEPYSSQDHSDWFKPATALSAGFQSASAIGQNISTGFQSASFMRFDQSAKLSEEPEQEIIPSFQSANFISASSSTNVGSMSAGFQTASKGIIAPSAAAMAKAKAKMTEWQEKDVEHEPELRPVLRSVLNESPSTPSPAVRPKPFSSPLLNKGKLPFRSPLHVQPPKPTPAIHTNSPLNPSSGFVNARSQLTAKDAVLKTPIRPKTTPARFVTPFKAGMRPGEPGRKLLDEKTKTTASSPSPVKKPHPHAVFDLDFPQNRKTLSSSGLRPRQYSITDLERMGIDPNDLTQITPSTALYYEFYDPNSPSARSCARNADNALAELLARGCRLATKAWVSNHWCLILWKLAGLVALDPESELREDTRRWCWRHMLNQLLYRYEREIQRGIRPPLRQIAAQDVPASYPLVLCVSDIVWEGSNPELEVTDGWYRLRAQVDKTLSRAIADGKLCQGRKIMVVGASLSDRKEANEILEAYDSNKLMIGGNRSKLVPWHTKLGFTEDFPTCTLRSLTPDGGVVPALDIVITQVFPIFWVEFRDGKSMPRRQQSEEAKECDNWTRRRQVEETKLRAEHLKKENKYLAYADRLDRKVSASFQIQGDGPPDHIDSLYDELEDQANQVIARVSSEDAGWLAHHIRKEVDKEREKIRDDIDRELNNLVPPRVVYSGRIMLAEDAKTDKHPANRVVQITVWDVTRLQLTEGKPAGYFQVGQRFHVTTLYPTHHSSWMGQQKGAQVFLCTKTFSRWSKYK